MTHPHIRHAFVMRIIEDALLRAGFSSPTLMGDGSALFWPPRPKVGAIRILVLRHETETEDPFVLAQRIVDEALTEIGAEAA